MGKPIRIQLSRMKGWRMPANTVNCARPGKWGNPYKVGEDIFIGLDIVTGLEITKPGPKNQREAVNLFQEHTLAGCESRLIVIKELAGKNLACWCKLGTPCHADLLLSVANPNTQSASS